METVIAELGTALLCLLAGSYIVAWMASLLIYVSTLL